MSVLPFGEVFGHSVDDFSPGAIQARQAKHCPFMGSSCNKGNKDNPLGICSYSDGHTLTTVCPNRFLERNRLFRDVAQFAFPEASEIVVGREIRILRDRNRERKLEK